MLHLLTRPRRVAGPVLVLALLSNPCPAQVSARGPDPAASSREISSLIAARDVESGADLSARLMGGGSSRERMLSLLKQMSDFGPSQYVDRVYARPFGESAYDIIDRINFDKAVVFIRYFFHVERGAWQLSNFTFKTEAGLPLPRDWIHIYPDGILASGKR